MTVRYTTDYRTHRQTIIDPFRYERIKVDVERKFRELEKAKAPLPDFKKLETLIKHVEKFGKIESEKHYQMLTDLIIDIVRVYKNFTEIEITNLNNKNVEFKSFFCEILQ